MSLRSVSWTDWIFTFIAVVRDRSVFADNDGCIPWMGVSPFQCDGVIVMVVLFERQC